MISRRESAYVTNLCVPVPLGAQVIRNGVLFSIFSRHATQVWLLLFEHPDQEQPSLEIELLPDQNRTGDIWHIFLSQAKAGMAYVYRMDGEAPANHENVYDPEQWLLDPYAFAVAGHRQWGATQGLPPGKRPRKGANTPKGIIIDHQFNWGRDKAPNIAPEDTIYYETHVRGYTMHPSAKCRALPGSYLALTEKIPYIKKLGIRSVELLPIHEFNEMEYYHENDARKNLRNFWGYSTMAFFAPMGRYAAGGNLGNQVTEFKQMVKAFHSAGIEVILDVVYNHTSEGGRGGPTTSFRGIDQSVYYMLENDGKNHKNYTGCGNTVSCNHTVTQQLILHSLRYWKQYMHVDGFRFDLASIFTRGLQGEVLHSYTIVDQIADDPILRDTKLVAEAWDAAGLYQVGNFPNKHWAEWNGKFRDDVRQFWKRDPHTGHTFTERFMGSPDMYAPHGWGPAKCVNLISCHDGFTVRDVCSYNAKHNEANFEQNRDGENHNYSQNFGIEGPTQDAEIESQRIQQQKNLIGTTLLAHGTPLLLAGDEFGRTQKGSNNAYCQDNEVSWVNWDLLSENSDLYAFTRKAVAFRLKQPALRPLKFMKRGHGVLDRTEIWWFNHALHDPDWAHEGALGCWINGDPAATGRKESGADIMVAFNTLDELVEFQLPKTRRNTPWRLGLSSQIKPPSRHGKQRRASLAPRSLNVWYSG